MSGEIHRLKRWWNYSAKQPNVDLHYEKDCNAGDGIHAVAVILGAIHESQPVTEKWVEEQMRSLGWVREDSEQARAIPDGAKYPAVSM